MGRTFGFAADDSSLSVLGAFTACACASGATGKQRSTRPWRRPRMEMSERVRGLGPPGAGRLVRVRARPGPRQTRRRWRTVQELQT